MTNVMIGSKTKFQNQPMVDSYSIEIKQSAIKINNLIKVCAEELNKAEYVFNSKPKVQEIAKPNIFEQITLISGCSVRISHLGEQYKAQVIEQVSKLWEEQVEELRKKWFLDTKQQPKKGIGWGEKSSFIKEIPSEIESQSKNMFLIIQDNLIELHKEIAVIDLRFIYDIANQESKNYLNRKINSIGGSTESSFCNPMEYLHDKIKDFEKAVIAAVEAVVNKGWGDILWEEILKLKTEILSQIVQIVTSIFDNRVERVTQAVEEVMSFYNDFLERQERYQQETPEQRKAEKAWIDQQRQQLEQVQRGLEAILSTD
jgi:uncharacterized protein (UPF0305 family)